MKKCKNSFNYSTLKCPYCGSSVLYRSADGIYKDNSSKTMLYVCSKYPECDAYVRVHPGTNKPVGTMANQQLRLLREKTHKAFDKIHKSGIMTKQEAYYWLANLIDAPLSEAHIGYLREYYCQKVLDESQKLLKSKRNKSNKTE